jgi:hypothetical protein
MKKQRVTSLRGIFVEARDAKTPQAWYRRHPGLSSEPAWDACSPDGRDATDRKMKDATVLRVSEARVGFFGRGRQTATINHRVASLKRWLGQIEKAAVWLGPEAEKNEDCQFGWVRGTGGSRLELPETPARG